MNEECVNQEISQGIGELSAGWRISLKYTIDRLLAMSALIVLSPLMVFIGLLIRAGDGGPIFFAQERIGLGARIFNCYKFRTMLVNADDHLDDQGLPTRSRITRIGKFLRWSSLDEIPQLLNICRGEMSIIGPRPALPSHLPRYSGDQIKRLRMRPGITGLAQVNGRNTLPWSKRIEYDNTYIEEFSLTKDLTILAKTIRVAIMREGIVLDRNPHEVDDLASPADQREQ